MIPSIETFSGRLFDLSAPDPREVSIFDIAHALANICRFTGHTKQFYSVAEHSWHCSFLVPPQDQIAALLHDAPEAYVGDVSSPLKSLLPDYRMIEARVSAAVHSALGLPEKLPASVKQADLAMLRLEQREAMNSVEDWPSLAAIAPAGRTLRFFEPDEASAAFISRYQKLARRNVA